MLDYSIVWIIKDIIIIKENFKIYRVLYLCLCTILKISCMWSINVSITVVDMFIQTLATETFEWRLMFVRDHTSICIFAYLKVMPDRYSFSLVFSAFAFRVITYIETETHQVCISSSSLKRLQFKYLYTINRENLIFTLLLFRQRSRITL